MSEKENKLLESFLNRTFFSGWKNAGDPRYGNYQILEFQINAKCDLSCRYCYYCKFQKQLYPDSIADDETIINNMNMVLRWLTKNQMTPKFHLFSGEMFSQEIGFAVLESIVDWGIQNNSQFEIVIPTNFTFIFEQQKIDRLEKILTKARKNNIHIILSGSIDGKCYDNTLRPIKDGRIRDDEYYNKFFFFCKKWDFGFHPMIYSKGIEKWKENFLWFQSKFKEFDLPFMNLYLLEVRNKEWTRKQIKEFYNFIRFVVNWTYKTSGLKHEDFTKFVFSTKLLNLFHCFSSTYRGMGCSVQSTIQLRLGDLSVPVCHRTQYQSHKLWKFKVEKNEISGVEAININLLLAVASLDHKTLPLCEYCIIKEMCNGQCLGSMYENNGDIFMPVPTVCALEHAKVLGILDGVGDIGEMKYFYQVTDQNKRDSIRLIEKTRGVNYGL
jgi:radical SAM protein with 4Fe4S-binding SPASM domain